MSFVYSVFLPGLGREVWIEEINYKSYKDLVKSMYNKDDSSFILHSNRVIEQIAPGLLEGGLNIVDKIILLVNARSISVKPDLNVKCRCDKTGKEFEAAIELDNIFETLSNVECSNTIQHKNTTVKYSISKARDEVHFLEKEMENLYIYQLASCIDIVDTSTGTINFNNLDFKARCRAVENLPVQLTTAILKDIVNIETAISKYKLLLVKSPFTGLPVVDIDVSIDTAVLRGFLKLLFTDDLNNLYRLNFQLISILHFTGDYIETISPAEMYLYWSLHLQDSQKEEPASGKSFGGTPSDI